MFVVSLSYRTSIGEVEAHISPHRDFLDRYYAAGIFLASGGKTPRTGGVILANGKVSREELDTILAEDPFHIHGIAEYEVIEFKPTKYAPELADFL
ncbi:YciI family protein [Komagataeibacter nataicola]|uniref:GTP cyclohydrolase n=1 Tax=Komagataeibacter rhaeticus TaxID=215221 RepID=A0A858JQB1_9PROT|nr:MULTISPECIES: YciI family protein [Komagataeibacter]QIP36248.1 GTP cyclohydrolase [Komagataeibacter rhaeticus]QOC46009.1 GTP cyclohydrolase [Komagataeibacter rhaeticus]WEQ55793.1 YciI family protein [Komagataeibacter nataicola]